jgi:hypothetical protein
MPAQQIFFGNDQRSGDQQLAGASPFAVNVLVDGAGAVRRRPGIASWADFPATAPSTSAIIGISSFGGDLYYVNNNREIYKVATGGGGGGVVGLSGGGAETYLLGNGRPAFAETAFRLVIAGGDYPSKVDAGASAAARLGGNPPVGTQVAAINQRIFLNNYTDSSTLGRIDYSRPGNAGNESFGNLQFKTAEGRPDAIVALKDNANELWVFGETTLQVYSPDPNGVISPGRSVNRGIASADSVIRVDDNFAWLDEKRDFVAGDGRTADILSQQVAGTIDRISSVTDCWGFRALGDQFGLLCWQFTSDGRTFVLQEGGGWAQWHGWDPTTGYTLFPVYAHYYWPAENLNLVGLGNGQIAKLDFDASTDLGDTIKAEVQTGFIHHGTDAIKKCDVARFTFKRGHTSSSAAQVLLSWRDDLGAWLGPKVIPLNDTKPIFTREIRSLGYYRARQWRMEFTNAADFVLARAEESYTVGGNN